MLIGANAAMGPLGIFCVGPFLPRVVRRFGARPVVFATIAVISGLVRSSMNDAKAEP